MSMQTEAARIIMVAEIRAALGARLVQGFALLFGLLALGIALAGLGASGQVLVQGYTRTAVSLLPIGLSLLPLLGLVSGATSFGVEHGGIELLLTQPISRTTIFLGRAGGLGIVLAGIALLGFGTAGLIVGVATGGAGLAGYLFVTGASLAVGLAGLALGILLGLVTRRRSAAIGAALAAWCVLVGLYDLLAILVLQFVGDGQPGALLLTLLALNPIDGLRALALTLLGADVLLGPTGAAMQQLLTVQGGAMLITGSLLGALLLPFTLGRRLFLRRDF